MGSRQTVERDLPQINGERAELDEVSCFVRRCLTWMTTTSSTSWSRCSKRRCRRASEHLLLSLRQPQPCMVGQGYVRRPRLEVEPRLIPSIPKAGLFRLGAFLACLVLHDSHDQDRWTSSRRTTACVHVDLDQDRPSSAGGGQGARVEHDAFRVHVVPLLSSLHSMDPH